jgi:SPASM domain peptide maturase of grasp-with-spasm system
MSNDNLYFKLFSSCIPVKGYKESIIYDLQYRNFYPISNILYDVLVANENRSVGELKLHFDNDFDQGIDSYFNLFVEENIGQLVEKETSFPKLDLSYKHYSLIEYAIIEYRFFNPDYNISKAIDQVLETGCEYIQFRFFGKVNIDVIIKVFEQINVSKVKGVEVYIDGSEVQFPEDIDSMFQDFKHIINIVLYNCIGDEWPFKSTKIVSTKVNIDPFMSDFVCPDSYDVNMHLFTLAQQYHSALYAKVSICIDGSIKNYVSHKPTYGFIQAGNLLEIVKSDSFQQVWNISRNNIEKCKDCKFRFACTYNSNLIKKEDKYHLVDDCSYDPYDVSLPSK